MTSPIRRYQFGPFQLQVSQRLLLRNGVRIHLTDKAFDTLLALVENHDCLVLKEQLLNRVWANTFVEEATLAQNIFTLRHALGDGEGGARYIETVPKRGYRFVAPVRDILDEAGPSVPDAPRSGSSVSFRRPLSRWTVPVGLVLLVIAAYSVWLHFAAHTRPSGARILLAVMPFENLTGDPQEAYLSDGFTEEMITQLSALNPSRLGVIARTTAMQYKGTSKRVDQIGRELGVDYLLEGSVRRQGDRIRISSQLIETRRETHLWAREYDRDLRDILAVEAEVSQSVVNAVQIRLTPAGQARLARAGTVNLEAFEAYLKGRYLYNGRTIAGMEKSVAYFQEAVAKQPDYALAYAGLADSYNILANWGLMRPNDAYPKAKAAAMRALEIDPSLAEAQVALAFAQFLYDWDWSAEDGFRKAIQSSPGYGPAHQWYGVILVSSHRYDEAMAEEERAQQADPFSLIIQSVKGWVNYLAHHYDNAIAACRQTLEMDPTFSPAHAYLGLAYEAKGMYPDSIRELETAARASDRPFDLAGLAHAYAVGGRRQDALTLVADIEQRARKGYFPAYFIAIAYAGLGDRDRTFAWLEKAYQERFPWLIHLKVEPRLGTLHDDPRFQSLARRIGLP